MYEQFKIGNAPTLEEEMVGTHALEEIRDIKVANLFAECGGYSFWNGMFKVHTFPSSFYWSTLISKYYKTYDSKFVPFGYDWMGRQFAVDLRRENYILMFDPSTGEDFELNQDLVMFFIEDLIKDRDSILSGQLFHLATEFFHVEKIGYNNCIGYKIPLFLNGTDTLDNRELCDMEVYWEFQCQIYHQIKDLPPDTKIKSIKFE